MFLFSRSYQVYRFAREDLFGGGGGGVGNDVDAIFSREFPFIHLKIIHVSI